MTFFKPDWHFVVEFKGCFFTKITVVIKKITNNLINHSTILKQVAHNRITVHYIKIGELKRYGSNTASIAAIGD